MFSIISVALVASVLVRAAPTYLTPTARKDCDITACGIALAPAGVGCVSAAVQAGANPIADAGCAAGVANLGVNTPEPCKACFADILDAIPDPIKKAFGDASDAVGKALNATKIGDCDAARCGIALAPTGVACVGAIVAAGANPLADLGCAASLINIGVNTPAICQPCVDAIKEKIPDVLKPVVEAVGDAKDVVKDVVDKTKDVVDDAKDAVGDAADKVGDALGDLFKRQADASCDIAKCGVALAPTGVGCVAAAVELGANPLADAGCVAGVVNLGVNAPAVCAPCFSSLGDAIEKALPAPVNKALDKAGDVVGDAVDDVKDGISGLFD
jgi:hypothetical protein